MTNKIKKIIEKIQLDFKVAPYATLAFILSYLSVIIAFIALIKHLLK